MIFELVLLILILVSLWFGLYQVVKQQGRMILRLDALDQRVDQLANINAKPAEPDKRFLGEEFPAFRLPDLSGNEVALADFRGSPVLVVHWNPGCGFCDMIAPDLVRLEAESAGHQVRLLLLAQGEADANRKLAAEHGLKCPILLLKDAEVPAPFKDQGTPVAFLLDAEGRVARPIAVGSVEVPVLAAEAASADNIVAPAPAAPAPSPAHDARDSRRLVGEKPLSESRIVRDGLKAGTLAPPFCLPDVYGRTVALDEFRGRRVLLVFTDPHCGPCDAVAPQLAKLHRKHANNGMAFVMVGRGEPEDNRKKTEQHRIGFPVVLQEKWKLSTQYGIFATPVAFLIGGDGVIEKDVAIGPDPILALAREGLTGGKQETI